MDDVVEVIREYYVFFGLSDICLLVFISVVVVIVDKIDILVGFFFFEEVFMGLKDLYVLRCVVFGIICFVLENGLCLLFIDFIGEVVK